jgi:hypothetical protein
MVRLEGSSGAPINQEDTATPLHNGHVGDAQLPEAVEDAVIADMQGSLYSLSAPACVVFV